MTKRTDMTKHVRDTFLNGLRETCNVSEAARLVNISRSSLYLRRKTDADFAKKWDEAEQDAADKLEREAWRRAVEGFEKPIIYKGHVTDSYKEYSDRMLELLLKAHRPDKFKKRVTSEITGKDGAPMQIDTISPSQRLKEMLDRMVPAVHAKK